MKIHAHLCSLRVYYTIKKDKVMIKCVLRFKYNCSIKSSFYLSDCTRNYGYQLDLEFELIPIATVLRNN